MEANIHQKELNKVLKVLPKLNLPELEEVMEQIVGIRKKKMPNVLSHVETELLRKINKPISATIQKQYDILLQKRNNDTLNDLEYEELLDLTSYIENQNVKRLSYLIELAKFRNISLDELILQLELKPRIDAA